MSNSLEELKIVQQTASDLARQLDFPASLGINISRNEVELYVTDKNAFEIALSIAGETLPDEVILLERNEFSVNESDLSAGLSLRRENSLEECTSGFAVKSATTGQLGILTAGHCHWKLKFDGELLDYQNQVFDGSYDVQWHTPRSSSSIFIINRVRTCTAFGFSCGSRAIVGTISNVPVGSYVCKYGAITGKTCGTVIDTNFKPDSTRENEITREGIVIDRKVERSPTFIYVSNQNGENISEGGDSGGPWFIGNYAIGIHSAGSIAPVGGIGGLDAIFMPIEYISGLGVSILTQ